MLFRFLADAVALLHFGFIVFAIFGGFAVLWRRWAMWLHIPAAVWAALIEFAGWICPLTHLENWLRVAGGEAAYGGGFIDYYIVPRVYPAGLTRPMQYAIGAFVIAFNALAYGLVFRARRTKPAPSP